MMQNTEPRLTCTGYGFFLPEPAQFFNKSRSIKKFLYYYSTCTFQKENLFNFIKSIPLQIIEIFKSVTERSDTDPVLNSGSGQNSPDAVGSKMPTPVIMMVMTLQYIPITYGYVCSNVETPATSRIYLPTYGYECSNVDAPATSRI